jgi:hypothetical protein
MKLLRMDENLKIALFSILLIVGCVDGATLEDLESRSRFDLECGEISTVNLAPETYGVTGCGKRSVYVRMCERSHGEFKTCKWLLDSEPKK